MANVTRAVFESIKTCDFVVLNYKCYPAARIHEICLWTPSSSKEICYVDFLIEMRLKGFILTDTLFITDTHFITKIVKA